MKRILWVAVLLSLLGGTALADAKRHDSDHHQRSAADRNHWRESHNERHHQEWARHHERERRDWRRHEHGNGFRNADRRPAGWDKGHKQGWQGNAVPPGQAKK
jgi:hypothetical protein